MSTDGRRFGQAQGHGHFMHHLKSSPPLALLRGYVGRLEAGGVVVALGGSGLLAALGLTETVRDWDLTSDDPYERVVAALAGDPHTHHGSDALHADRKLALANGTVEVIIGFAFHVPSGVVRIPTIVSARRDDLPIGSPEAWAVAYHLLARRGKSEALFGHLERHGADPATIARLLGEPLPPPLPVRLGALPTSSNP